MIRSKKATLSPCVAIVAALWLAQSCIACRCVPPVPLESCNVQDDPKGAALLVKVISRDVYIAGEGPKLPGFTRFQQLGDAISRVEVLEVFKDVATLNDDAIKPGDEIDIKTRIGSSLCGYILERGEEYIVFVTRTGEAAGLGKPEACLEKPKVTSSCKASFPSWSYITETGKCEEFTYGGCGGTKNNFDSEEVCLETCCATLQCSTPLFTTSCSGNILNPSRVQKLELREGCT